MLLIKSVAIRGFRSIHDQSISGLGHLNAVVGKNSSGKSNLLRALNLFFTGEPQPGQALAFPRDLHERPKSRKKKRIEVAVEFELPVQFKIRRELAALVAAGRHLLVTRRWELDKRRQISDAYEVYAGGTLLPNSAEVARQLLSLISYRYIPNRTIPTDLLRDESQAIADAIFMRMKGDKHASAILSSLSAAAGRMMEGASTALKGTGAPISAPSLAVASTLGEMLRMTGFTAMGAHGLAVQDEDWGAGHQAFFLYEVLQTLDTDYSRFFGWRQATIWAVEEPESGLHHDLSTQLASQFRQYAATTERRLQVLMTTHSPTFVMAADRGFWTEIVGPETSIRAAPVRELVRAAESSGVCSWTHPVLSFPWNPVVLVEGPTDELVLNRVADLCGYPSLKFVALPTIDAEEPRGGVDVLVNFLRRSQKLIPNRPAGAPLIVLVDWDVPDNDLNKLRSAYGPGGDKAVHRMNPKHADPALGEDFRGIERFYSAAVVESAVSDGTLVAAKDKSGVLSISKSKFEPAKATLREAMLKEASPARLKPLASVVADVQRCVESLLTEQRAKYGV